MRQRFFLSSICAVGTALLFAQSGGCGGSSDTSGFGNGPGTGPGGGDGSVGPVNGDGGSNGDGPSFCTGSNCTTGGDSSVAPPCTGLQCQQHSCAGGATTTITGKVFDPAGRNPLYGVSVYVPNSKPAALSKGASCASCDSLYTGDPIAVGITDATGTFTIKNAPDGANIPLVIQVGKWRRQITVPNVTQCGTTTVANGSARLPKNGTEGDIPNIAVSTGGADTLECLLRRVGLDASEYVGGAGGSGHIHMFQGSGGPTMTNIGSSPSDLWGSTAQLMPYDIVLLSCEGSETSSPNQQALHDYASAGGRVFASHFHYAFFNSGPYASENLATWSPGTNDLGTIQGNIVTTLWNGQAFPKGVALKSWLGTVGALSGGQLPITEAKHNADVAQANKPSQPWITDSASGATEYFSFNTPTNAPVNPDSGAPNYCGRVVFSDLHVGAASGDTGGVVPDECSPGKLSPQEDALEFMLFDLSSCVTANDQPPQPPPPPPPR